MQSFIAKDRRTPLSADVLDAPINNPAGRGPQDSSPDATETDS